MTVTRTQAGGGIVHGLVDDLVAEQGALDGLVRALDDDGWTQPTPAAGWLVVDQVHHLAFFDEAAALAVVDTAAYERLAQTLLERGSGWELDDGAATPPRSLLRRWRAARDALERSLRAVDPDRRLLWFGREMGVASFASARLMECWCHGQDVRDAVGAPPSVSARLRHVVDIGVRALPFAFALHGLEPPTGGVRVEATAPDGALWTWGPESALDSVRGTALDLAFVVTRRRHPDDTGLVATGSAAARWLGIAQAFAGPPGSGRPPGLFPRLDGLGGPLPGE
jgi:uncharacterized protein (TIGR03084 family)